MPTRLHVVTATSYYNHWSYAEKVAFCFLFDSTTERTTPAKLCMWIAPTSCILFEPDVQRKRMAMDLEAGLKAARVWYRFLEKPETAHTTDASHASGIELNRITKNLVCKTSEGEYALLVITGDHRVDLRKAAAVLRTRNVQLLGFHEAEEISGYQPGGTPSVCHKTPMKVIVDKMVLAHETLFCGGGTRSRLLELRTEDVLRMSEAIIADISKG
jgi:Cys-tRNA(Pro)/Cys-tRNA(Cys) deacylase